MLSGFDNPDMAAKRSPNREERACVRGGAGAPRKLPRRDLGSNQLDQTCHLMLTKRFTSFSDRLKLTPRYNLRTTIIILRVHKFYYPDSSFLGKRVYLELVQAEVLAFKRGFHLRNERRLMRGPDRIEEEVRAPAPLLAGGCG